MDDKLKLSYVAPNLNVVLLESADVIATSGPLWSSGSDFDADGWT